MALRQLHSKSIVGNVKAKSPRTPGHFNVNDDDYEIWIQELANELGLGKPPKVLPNCRIRRNYSCDMCQLFTQNPRKFLYHQRDFHHQRIRGKHTQKLQRHIRMCHGPAGGSATTTVEGSVSVPTLKRVNCTTSTTREVKEDSDMQNELTCLNYNECSGINETYNAERYENNNGQSGNPNMSFSFEHSIFGSDEHQSSESSRPLGQRCAKPVKIYRCPNCSYCTNIRARLTKHVKYHSMPVKKCEYCDFSSPYRWNLDRHCRNHFTGGELHCSLCSFSCDIKQSLTVHMQNHHTLNTSINTSSDVGNSNAEYLGVRGTSKLTRDENGSDVSQPGDVQVRATVQHLPLRSNTMSLAEVDSLECSYCLRNSTSLFDLNLHLLSCTKAAEASDAEQKENQFTEGVKECLGPDFDTKTEKHLTGYEMTRGTGIVFTGPNNFSNEMRKFFRCPYSGCKFFALHLFRFQAHVVGHFVTKPFQCSICEYKSSWSWGIMKHILRNTKDLEHQGAEVVLSITEDIHTLEKNLTFLELQPRYSKLVDSHNTSERENKGSCLPEVISFQTKVEVSKIGCEALRKLNTCPLQDGLTLESSHSRCTSMESHKSTPNVQPNVSSNKAKLLRENLQFWKCKQCSFRHVNKNVVGHHIRIFHTDNMEEEFTTVPSSGKTISKGQVEESSCKVVHGKDSGPDYTTGNPDFVYPSYVRNGKRKTKRYKCTECPSAFEKKTSFQVHIGLHGSGQRYQCTLCSYAVTYYANYVQHLKKHQGQPGIAKELLIPRPLSKAQDKISGHFWKCYRCPAVFASNQKTLFQQHVRNHYIRPQPHRISLKGFLPSATLKRRVSAAAITVRSCMDCEFKTTSKSAFYEHRKLHFQESGCVSPQP